MSNIQAFFVYGTLQRGGCRERCWPCAALSIEPATTYGSLHDLGPYPGLLTGSDTIGGELWRLRAEDVPRAVEVLDHVEGATGGEDGWYERRGVECRLPNGTIETAWCYFFAKPASILSTPRVPPDADGVCRWRAKGVLSTEY